MNALEAYRQQNDLTYEALAAKAVEDKTSVWRHCHTKRIPADAVPGYESSLGIPRWLMRPDLWPCPAPPPTPTPTPTQPQDAA